VKPGVSDPNLNFVERSKTDVNVMPNELVDFVNENTTYKALFRYGGDTDLLKRLIVAGFPPITERGIYEILSPESTIQWGGHYAFTTGYDDSKQEFVWQDSYLPKPNSVGKNTRMSYSDYIQGWRAFDYVFIVVYPADREADLLQVLGPWADSNWAAQHALDITNSEIPTLTGNDLFFAWFNKGTSYGLLTDYGNAALAYDYAYNSLYPNLPKTETEPLPYRIMWYQTGPYKAYFYTSRYQAVIDMADSNLKTPVAPKTLEESLFWRAMAEYTLGETDQAVADMRQALYYHPGFQSALDMMAQWGVNP
jgi:tetratricopeptide (TPR) repeat protein